MTKILVLPQSAENVLGVFEKKYCSSNIFKIIKQILHMFRPSIQGTYYVEKNISGKYSEFTTAAISIYHANVQATFALNASFI